MTRVASVFELEKKATDRYQITTREEVGSHLDVQPSSENQAYAQKVLEFCPCC